MYIIVEGNPVEGFTYFGLFKDPADATDYADRHFFGESWWVTNIEPVKETE